MMSTYKGNPPDFDASTNFEPDNTSSAGMSDQISSEQGKEESLQDNNESLGDTFGT